MLVNKALLFSISWLLDRLTILGFGIRTGFQELGLFSILPTAITAWSYLWIISGSPVIGHSVANVTSSSAQWLTIVHIPQPGQAWPAFVLGSELY